MGKEIERKFLVKGEFKSHSVSQAEIIQAYLSVDPERIVRLRLSGTEAILAIKTSTGKTLMTRNEWEIPVNFSDAKEIMEICLPGQISKTRYIVPFKGHKFEVDVFHGKNEGLIIAEIEFTEESEEFEKPDWLGEEVTGLIQYYNSNLI
jgi:adenylate cyclase